MGSTWARGCGWVAVLGGLALAFGACGGAQRPGELSAEQVRGGPRVACELDGPRARPLVVDLPAEERVALEAAMKTGIAVVSYDCEQLRLLHDCRLEGSYGFVGVTTKEEQIRLEDLDELQANLPFGTLDVDLSAGRTVDIAMMMVGQLRTPVPAASKKRLVGACDGATHYVHGATVGAFAMTQGTAAEAHAGVKLLVEVGSTQLSRKQTTRRDGNLQACRQATTNDAAPRPGCGALLRVDLTAFHDERGPGGAGTGGTTGMGGTAGTGGTTGIGGMGGAGGAGGTDDRRAKLPIELRRVCPKGFVLSGGKCTRRVRARLFRCEYGDTRTCVKQCRAGNTDSCVVLGVMHAHAYGAPKDAARAEELLGGACRPEDAQGGHLVACGELGVLEQGGHLGAPDPRRAERLLDKACQGGRSQSCLDLAVLRWYGPPEVRDQKRAAESFERGCRAGSLRSCTRLGMVLLVGGGVERDQPRSRALLKRTCDIGDDLGCAQVAMLLHYGLGGPADPAEAALMAQVACDAGEAAGCAYLGLAYDLGRGADEDKDRAYMLYHRACTLNRHLCTEFGFFQRMRGMGDHWRPYGKACGDTRNKPYGPPATCPVLDDILLFCDAGVLRSCGIAAGILYWFLRDDEARPLAQRACDGGDPRACRQLEIIDSGRRSWNPDYRQE